jgi:IS5 family transposase
MNLLANQPPGITRRLDELLLFEARQHTRSARPNSANHGCQQFDTGPPRLAASRSTKNKDGECEPEMHQTKKGDKWPFGVKSHISEDSDSDSDSGLVHTVIGTAANILDFTHQVTKPWGTNS